MEEQALSPRPNYLKAAFWNLYNVTSLSGVAATSVLTGQYWLLALGLAAEGLWLLFVPDNKRFRRAIDSQHLDALKLETIRRLQEQAASLPSALRGKVEALQARASEVKQECRRNPKLQGDFMASQLDRLDGLVAEYVHVAVTGQAAEVYLSRVDIGRLRSERERWRKGAEHAVDVAVKDIALQNGAILDKRLAIIDDLQRFTSRAAGQLSLIENTISLLRDQVVTMANPEALTGQLDEIVLSVQAIGESMRDAEAVVSSQPPLSELAPELPPMADVQSDAPVRTRVRERG